MSELGSGGAAGRPEGAAPRSWICPTRPVD